MESRLLELLVRFDPVSVSPGTGPLSAPVGLQTPQCDLGASCRKTLSVYDSGKSFVSADTEDTEDLTTEWTVKTDRQLMVHT